MNLLRGVAEAVAAELARRVAQARRAVVAAGVVPESELHRLAVEIAQAWPAASDRVCWFHLDRDPSEDAEALSALNRARDGLLPRVGLVLLTASNDPDLRRLRVLAPDLLSVQDLSVRVVGDPVRANLDRLRDALRRRAQDQAMIDLSGLLPGDPGKVRFSVGSLYIDLAVKDRESTSEGLFSRVPRAPRRRAVRADRLLLLGDPGSGKSTWLLHLLEVYATGRADPLGLGPRVPVLVPLPAWARWREEQRVDAPLAEFVTDWLGQIGVPEVDGVSALGPELLLLLDGLDEVGSVSGEVPRALLHDVYAWREPAVVVTARSVVAEVLTAHDVAELSERRLDRVRPEQVRSFLTQLFALRGRVSPEEQAQTVARQIAADRELTRLAERPLLLVLLGLLHDFEGRIPDRRFLLYQRLSDVLLDRWERARARARGTAAPGRSVALGETRRLIGALAWTMIESGRAEIDSDELLHTVMGLEQARGADVTLASARAEALVARLQGESALLAAGEAGRWRFVHPTVGEYFAGLEAGRGGARWEQVVADPFRPELREVVVFAAAELGCRAEDARLHTLAVSLCRRHQKGGRYATGWPVLIGAILREDPGFSPPDQDRLVDRFVELCFVPRYGRKVSEVGKALKLTAAVAMDRSWGPAFRHALEVRLHGGDFPWRRDHFSVLIELPRVLVAVGISPEPWLGKVCAHPDPIVAEASLLGWLLQDVRDPTRFYPWAAMHVRRSPDSTLPAEIAADQGFAWPPLAEP